MGDGKRVDKVEDFLNVGDKVEVQIAEIDARGKVYLDKVRPEGAPEPEAAPPDGPGDARRRGGDRPAAATVTGTVAVASVRAGSARGNVGLVRARLQRVTRTATPRGRAAARLAAAASRL